MTDLEDLRDRLTAEESRLLDKLVASPDAARQGVAVADAASAAGLPLDDARHILRLFADVNLVQLDPESDTARLRAEGVFAARRSNAIDRMQSRLGMVGQLWNRLGKRVKALAKVATGLIGLAIIGQVMMGLYYIAWVLHAAWRWFATGEPPAPTAS